MEPWHLDDQATIYHGDCLEVLRELPDASVDSVVTDPPYGLEFMGKDWDSFSPVDLDRGGRWTKDKRGTAGKLHEDTGRAYGRVAYGANRSYTSECRTCGRRDAFRNPHDCTGEPRWERTPVDEGAPPQMLAFQTWCELWAAECLRVLKPGGHLLAFGGTRTWHRLAVAIEDAGFEIRDSIAWMYGSGFPKSKNVALGIDKGEGHPNRGRAIPTASTFQASDTKQRNKLTSNPVPEYEAKSEAARRWQGWGTALKPAHEPIVVARKPLTGTVAANVLEHGTGALNIDGCRIGWATETERAEVNQRCGPNSRFADTVEKSVALGDKRPHAVEDKTHAAGRWPANVLLDEDQAAALDQQSGIGKGTARVGFPGGKTFGGGEMKAAEGVWYGDSGGASRFFYVAKAPAKERPKVDGVAHPTVKPLTLMRWLCRLVTPPGGVVLEPFAGSGTTIEAALMEGFRVVAIEREPDYLPLIAARLERVAQEPDDGQLTFDASA